jgi:hypothetical protein
MKRLFEFLFDRWTSKVVSKGSETWERIYYENRSGLARLREDYKRDYVEYELTNKFDGSKKIVKKYLN